MPPSSRSENSHWTGHLCQELAYLRRRATETGPASANELEELVAEAATGHPHPDWTERIVRLLRGLGINAALSERGLWQSHPSGPDHMLPASAEGVPSTDVHRCPRGLCDRAVVRRPGEAEPFCQIAGLPMTVPAPPR